MLQRRLGLLQAVSLNMSMMVGIGPFITIPTLLGTMGGPQAMLGWILGGLVALCDGMVWSELAAAFPGSGGTYHFYDSVYGESRPGRLLKFLFVWQFLFSGPLEIATGAIGVAKYLGYFIPVLDQPAWRWNAILPGQGGAVSWGQVAAIGVMALVTFLAYRRIAAAGRLMVILWVGMLLTVGWVIASGLMHFDAARAFDFPERAWDVDRRWVVGLGMALGIAMYDFLGYYQICYLGDEVADAPRTLPRSIVISTLAVCLVYLIDEPRDRRGLAVAGGDPVQPGGHRPGPADPGRDGGGGGDRDDHLDGRGLDLRGAPGLQPDPVRLGPLGPLLPHLRGDPSHRRFPASIAHAGGRHGDGRLPGRPRDGDRRAADGPHPDPVRRPDRHRVLLAVAPGKRPPLFRMPFYPLPALVALFGWLYVFAASPPRVVAYGVGSVVLGVLAFLAWDRLTAGFTGGKTSDVGGSLASWPLDE